MYYVCPALASVLIVCRKLRQPRDQTVHCLLVDAKVPFNLKTPRRHLSRVVLARHVLSEDTMLRQHLLEQSVLNVAVKRMKH